MRGIRRRPGPFRRRRWPRLEERRRLGVFLLPGLLTAANLLAGFCALVLTLERKFWWAAVAVLLGILMDILDGKVARLTRTTTHFGQEFDSLADVVSFGLAPAFLVYAWALEPLGRVGQGAAFLYLVCGALRLARFNVLSGLVDRRYFIGLPIPGAAGTLASLVLLLDGVEFGRLELLAVASATYLLAFLMVSTLRYYSFKELNLEKRHAVGVLLVGVLAMVIVYAHPPVSLFLAFAGYAVSGPVRRVLVGRREPAPPRVLVESGSGDGGTRG